MPHYKEEPACIINKGIVTFRWNDTNVRVHIRFVQYIRHMYQEILYTKQISVWHNRVILALVRAECVGIPFFGYMETLSRPCGSMQKHITQ